MNARGPAVLVRPSDVGGYVSTAPLMLCFVLRSSDLDHRLTHHSFLAGSFRFISPARCGMRLPFCREKIAALSLVADSRRIVLTHAIQVQQGALGSGLLVSRT